MCKSARGSRDALTSICACSPKRHLRTSILTLLELERVVNFLRAPPGLGGEEGSWKGSMPFQVGAADPIAKGSIDSRFGSHTAAKSPIVAR